jgi:Flp pilus assembly protein TadB
MTRTVKGCAHGWSALYVYLFWRQRENDKALGSGPLSKVRASSVKALWRAQSTAGSARFLANLFLVLFPMVLVSAAVFWMFSSVLARCACVFLVGLLVTMLLRVGGFFNGTRCVPVVAGS